MLFFVAEKQLNVPRSHGLSMKFHGSFGVIRGFKLDICLSGCSSVTAISQNNGLCDWIVDFEKSVNIFLVRTERQSPHSKKASVFADLNSTTSSSHQNSCSSGWTNNVPTWCRSYGAASETVIPGTQTVMGASANALTREGVQPRAPSSRIGPAISNVSMMIIPNMRVVGTARLRAPCLFLPLLLQNKSKTMMSIE
jgi:hypothetical protein